jgi:hypothetical protein
VGSSHEVYVKFLFCTHLILLDSIILTIVGEEYKLWGWQWWSSYHHARVVRLHLWKAASIGPVVHPLGDMWAWTTMVEWHQQGKTPNSLPELWQSYQQSSSSKARGTGRGNDKFCLMKYLIFQRVLQHDSFTSPLKEGMLRNFYCSAGFEPVNLGSSGKHTNHLATEDD